MSHNREDRPDGSLSRRQIFPTLIGAAGIAMSFASGATAAAKVDQKTAQYRDYPNNGLRFPSANHVPASRRRYFRERLVQPFRQETVTLTHL